MHYTGVVPIGRSLQLAMLEEVRAPEPPIRLSAIFFEPGSAAQVAAELGSLQEVVVAVGAPLSAPRGGSRERACDEAVGRRGVPPLPGHAEVGRLRHLLRELPLFTPRLEGREGRVPEGSYQDFPLFETHPDALFCALQGRRLPAGRHPLGMQLRIGELEDDHVLDEGGDLWHRRAEEVDAAGCALGAHRYAVGHASWLGDPDEAVLVLPGSSIPEEFPREGVLPVVERLQLPPVPD